MLVSLLLAAATPASGLPPAAPVSGAAVGEAVPAAVPTDRTEPIPARGRAVQPTGSTQPYVDSRPSIGFVSAGTLRDRCQATSPGQVSYCFAYITGVHDSVRAYETWLRFREFCPPYTGSQADLRRAFLSYLKDHPASESGEAASVVVLALKDGFPCVDPNAASAPKNAPVLPGKSRR